MDPQKCSQLYEKLIAIEKKLSASDNKTDEGARFKCDISIPFGSHFNQLKCFIPQDRSPRR